MNPYRFNPILDSLRLLRAVVFEKLSGPHKDPFIGVHPARILARKTLFKFDDIASEAGHYLHSYPNYVPYISPQPILLEHLPARYGYHAFTHLMRAKQMRLSEITQLLKQSNIAVEATEECWAAIGNWVRLHVEANLEPMHNKSQSAAPSLHGELALRPLWYSILIDLSLLLGEHLIAHSPHYSWQFWGDAHYPTNLGRSPWILKEPLPDNGVWEHQPQIMMPFNLLRNSASKILRDKHRGKQTEHDQQFGWGLIFRSSMEPQKSSQQISHDDLVADFIEYYQAYENTTAGQVNEDDKQKALSIFLESYYQEKKHLPSTTNLQQLINIFGALPNWVTEKTK